MTGSNEIAKRELRQRIGRIINEELPPLIEVPVPSSVRDSDWFCASRIENILKVYAFPAYQIPNYSGKIFPALAMLLADEVAGKFNARPSIAGSSSGNFMKDLANLSRMFNIERVYAVVAPNIPLGKVRHMEFSGAEVVYAPEGIPATDYVYQFAKENGYLVEDQYTREEAITGHTSSMNHIAREMNERTGEAGFILGAITGTCSTLMAGKYLKPQFGGRVKIFGVTSMSKVEKVPGSRTSDDLLQLRKIGGFGWQLYEHPERFLDFPLVTSVTKEEAYKLNAELFHQNIIQVGPTGALLEAGFYHLLRDRVEYGQVESLKNKNGQIVAVLFWMDSHLAYIDDQEYASYFKH